MSKKEIHFMGLLANIDKSILDVKLDLGFKIHTISAKKGVALLSIFAGLPPMEIYKKLTIFNCLSRDKLYCVGNSFESDIELGNDGALTSYPSGMGEFSNKLVYGYLGPVIKLMRLFKGGNICMPLEYYYFIDDNIPKSFTRTETNLYIPSELYTLESSEIPDLQEFIQNTELPFKESFLQLAFGNFELSYQIHDRNLSFLSLMISLETLFNPGRQELRYRVSRNTAVILGKEKEDSEKIFREIKNLYDKRSDIVHTGKSNTINEEDLLKLRHYVRESIKVINNIGETKDELLEILNSCGFGERSWTK